MAEFTWPFMRYRTPLPDSQELVAVLRLPDNTDAMEFHQWMEEHFMGITPAMREKRERDQMRRK